MKAQSLSHALIAVLALVACNGDIDGSTPRGGGHNTGAGGSGNVGGAGGDGNVGGQDPGPPVDCTAEGHKATALHATMLSPSQYNNSVLDFLKVGGDPSKTFSAGANLMLDDVGAEQRDSAAADVAHQAALSLASWSPCMAAACEPDLINWVGLHAYRHPLSDAERAELTKLFDAGMKEKDFATGVEWLLTGVLQSPDFLYQLVRPAAGEQAGQVVPLSSYELATRLSYFLWDSTPDDKLFDAAKADQFNDAGLPAQLDAIMGDAKFMRGVTGFYSNFFKVRDFAELARNDKGFNPLVSALSTSLLRSFTEIYKDASPNISKLFTGDSYYMNDTLRAFYGLQGSGTDFTATSMPGEGRLGILTHPAFMSLLARPDQSNPISRGLFIRRRLLCQELNVPENLVIPDLKPVTPGLSTRDRIDEHASNPACAGCHDQIDPPGYALENYDQVGRYREMDSGKVIDTHGTMTYSEDLDGPFAKGEELLTRISTSKTVKKCFAEQYFEFAVLRTPTNADKCSVDVLSQSFADSGDLKALVLSIANSDAFRYRSSEGAAQ